MVRGKIEIKKIENTTNRQVTFSKRRNGLFKKAQELSVLCDAKVSVVVVSGTSKAYEYHSPSTSMKEIVDLYQRTTGVDVWSSQYEKMEEHLRKLKEVNAELRLEIRRRLGQSLENMDFRQLRGLEQDIDDSLKVIRERRNKAIANKTETTNRKCRNQKNIFRNLHGYEPSEEEMKYWIMKNIIMAENYEPAAAHGIDLFDDGGANPVLTLHHPHQLDPSASLDLGSRSSDITTYSSIA